MFGKIIIGILGLFISFVYYSINSFKGFEYSTIFDEKFENNNNNNMKFNETYSLEVFRKVLNYRTVDYQRNSIIFKKAFQYLKISFPLFHEKLKKLNVPEKVPGFLYKWKGKNDGKKDFLPIILMAHMDVVGIEEENKWTSPPFKADIMEENGIEYIVARGTLDTKNTLVSIMNAVELLLQKGFTPNRSIYLSFGCDEEDINDKKGSLGGEGLSKYLKDQGIRFELGLDEGGAILKDKFTKFGIMENVGIVGVAEKGGSDINITINCIGGHSSAPDTDSCINSMNKVISSLQNNPFPAHTAGDLFQNFIKQTFTHSKSLFYKTVFALTRNFPFLLEKMFSKDKLTNAIIRTTIVPTIIQGGYRGNVLPKHVYTNFNIRVHPLDRYENVISHIKKNINDERVIVEEPKKYRDSKIIACSNCKPFHYVTKIINSVYPDALIVPNLLMAATDSHHFRDIIKYTYNFSPMVLNSTLKDFERIHGIDERTGVDTYIKGIKFFYNFIYNTDYL